MANQSALATFPGGGVSQVAITWPAMIGVYGTDWGISDGAVTTDGGGILGARDLINVTNTGATARVSDPNWQGTLTFSLYDMP